MSSGKAGKKYVERNLERMKTIKIRCYSRKGEIVERPNE